MTFTPAKPTKPMTKPFTKAPTFATPAIRELVTMHTTCRPAGTRAVDDFCAQYLDSIPGMVIDKEGNRILQVGSLTDHPVLWSSHTDTVHRTAGTQKVIYGGGLLSLHETSQASCLGADCTVGVWLMVNMIRRNVPGLYIFHASEEVGGLGSSYIAKHTQSYYMASSMPLRSTDVAPPVSSHTKGHAVPLTHLVLHWQRSLASRSHWILVVRSLTPPTTPTLCQSVPTSALGITMHILATSTLTCRLPLTCWSVCVSLTLQHCQSCVIRPRTTTTAMTTVTGHLPSPRQHVAQAQAQAITALPPH